MKKLILLTILLSLSLPVFAVPAYINYQGVLKNSSGALQNGTFELTLDIYSAETGGTAAFSKTISNVTVSDGIYNVALGPITNPTTVFDGTDKWLEVTVGTDTLSPRLKINSVAYAITASYAITAESATTANTAINANSATTADSASYATLAGTASTAATATSATSATSANTAGYATLAGTASTAATATTATSANTVADNAITSAKILAGTIDGSDLSPSIAISTDANITTTANLSSAGLTFSGAMAASGCTGSGTIAQLTSTSDYISNSNITASSIIFLTISPTSNNVTGLKVTEIDTANKRFKVGNIDNSSNGFGVSTPFTYLIVN